MSPIQILRPLGQWLFRLLYRVEVKGLENMRPAGDRALIVSNHVSMLDAVLLVLFLPGPFSFAINTHWAAQWWVRPFVRWFGLFPLDTTQPMALRGFADHIRAGHVSAIFPEGRLTTTGRLMRVYEGPGMVADKAGATIIPVRIDGLEFTPFGRLHGLFRIRWFPKVKLTVLPHRDLNLPKDLKGKARRAAAGQALADIMEDMIVATMDYGSSFPEAVIHARSIHGGRHIVAEDLDRTPLSYNGLLTRAFIAGELMATGTHAGEKVGLMLPTAAGALASILGLQLYGRVPAMLNFSTGASGMKAACETAQLKRIYTSHRFVDAAGLQEVCAELSKTVDLVYLDDLKDLVGLGMKLRGLFSALFPRWAIKRIGGLQKGEQAPAVVLFTSGSEGTPKGVVLSHGNLLSNAAQLAARLDFSPKDRVFNALPLFHSFGLTGGTVLPLLAGCRVFFYPSPLHYRIIPEMIYDQRSTILFATNTFLSGYARHAHPYDFSSLRYVFAGAEKLRDETRKLWIEKFGIRILEGYGATETAPVLSANTLMYYRKGSVGRLLPGIEHKLRPVPGIENGGELLVRGGNVMLGYLRHEAPGVLEAAEANGEHGWYETGDIVRMDEQGFIFILDRAKRFAKVGGEMVSLAAVEDLALTLWPDRNHAAASIPDAKKGEQVILLTDLPEAQLKDLQTHGRAQGVGEILLPKALHFVEEIPLLASGKTDFGALKRLVTELLGKKN